MISSLPIEDEDVREIAQIALNVSFPLNFGFLLPAKRCLYSVSSMSAPTLVDI